MAQFAVIFLGSFLLMAALAASIGFKWIVTGLIEAPFLLLAAIVLAVALWNVIKVYGG